MPLTAGTRLGPYEIVSPLGVGGMGEELFFGSLDSRQMLAVPLQSGTTLVAGRPQVLFEGAIYLAGGGARPYDIAPDGRFLIIRSVQTEAGVAPASNMIVVQNWFEELKRLVPVN